MWYVYCLENNDKNYLYVGSTKNLKRRVMEHNHGLSKSTKPHLPLSVDLSRRRQVIELSLQFPLAKLNWHLICTYFQSIIVS